MNKDQERYQKSFQKLHLSEDFRERLDARLEKEREDKKMKKTTFLGLTRAAAAVAVCTAVFGVGGICYAADVGGIRTKIEIWRYGEKSEVEVEADGMGYTWTDENGENGGFGGVIMDENGNDVKIMESVDMGDTDYRSVIEGDYRHDERQENFDGYQKQEFTEDGELDTVEEAEEDADFDAVGDEEEF